MKWNQQFGPLWILAVVAQVVRASDITVPGGSVTYQLAPFHFTTPDSTNTTRYQEVFSHSVFDGLSVNGIEVTSIGFYSQTPATNQRFMLSLELSTTARDPDGLSNVFAENTGPDNVVVFESLTPVFISTTIDQQGRNVYDFSLQRPFLYHPQTGNLLLDIRNFDSAFTAVDAPFFANVTSSGDSVSSLFWFDVNSPSGALGTDGLQVRFTYEPVPEPGPLALFLIGVVAFFATRMVSRRSAKKREGPVSLSISTAANTVAIGNVSGVFFPTSGASAGEKGLNYQDCGLVSIFGDRSFAGQGMPVKGFFPITPPSVDADDISSIVEATLLAYA